jgi:hypothetical protein
MGIGLALAALLAIGPAEAQRQARGGRGGSNYDPASVATIEARVQEVVQEAGRGGGSGVHLMLQTEGEATVVHLGPASWLTNGGMEIDVGDVVTVSGSTTVVAGEPVMIAREVRKGDVSRDLRNEDGLPAWRRQGPQASDGVGRPTSDNGRRRGGAGVCGGRGPRRMGRPNR